MPQIPVAVKGPSHLAPQDLQRLFHHKKYLIMWCYSLQGVVHPSTFRQGIVPCVLGMGPSPKLCLIDSTSRSLLLSIAAFVILYSSCSLLSTDCPAHITLLAPPALQYLGFGLIVKIDREAATSLPEDLKEICITCFSGKLASVSETLC